MAEQTRPSDLSSGVSDHKSLGVSHGRDTCVLKQDTFKYLVKTKTLLRPSDGMNISSCRFRVLCGAHKITQCTSYKRTSRKTSKVHTYNVHSVLEEVNCENRGQNT